MALLTAGAAAGALSHPTSEDPAAKTPASIALAFGFKGLSAFLSEAQLTTHLDSIESKENGKCEGKASGGGIRSAVDRISDKSTHVHGGTDDQLALKDSLGAVRMLFKLQRGYKPRTECFPLRKRKRLLFRTAACPFMRQLQFHMVCRRKLPYRYRRTSGAIKNVKNS